MRKFELKLKCLECGAKYRRTVKVADDAAVSDIEDPPCPKCQKAARQSENFVAFDPASGRAPAIGGGMRTRAIDETHRIVTEDHKMTDIRETPREGEHSMPALPPPLQRQVDNFWGGKKRGIPGVSPAALGRAAIGGAFAPERFNAPNVVKQSHDSRMKVPVEIIAGEKK